MKYSVSSIILAIGLLSYTSQAVPLLNNQGMDTTTGAGAQTDLVDSLLGKRQATTSGDSGAGKDGIDTVSANGLMDSTIPAVVQPVTETADKLALDPAEKLVTSVGVPVDTSMVTNSLTGQKRSTESSDDENQKNGDSDKKKKKKTDTSDKEPKSADE